MTLKLSIIIVHYKVREELFRCLDSIKKSEPNLTYEIIVVDNHEKLNIKNDLKKRFRKVKYIKSKKDIGFSAGNNLGASIASGEFLFFLAPDCLIYKNTIENLILFMESKKNIGVAAPILLGTNENPYQLQLSKKHTQLRTIFGLSFIDKIFTNNSILKDYWQKRWDKTKIREVNVVFESAFIVRKSLFEKIGGFDEHFFLYFEETDFCKRIKEAGYKIFIFPRAKVIQIRTVNTNKNNSNIQEIFRQRRLPYLIKHFELVKNILTERFLRIEKEELLFLLILLLGIFLRFYNINLNTGFYSEVGDNLLDIKNAYVHNYIPLIGAPTSHPWLYFGPLFYWMYGLILILSRFDPISHAYFGASIASLVIIFNYFFIKKIINQKVALISSFLISTSPLYLIASNVGRFIYVVPLLIYPFIYILYQIVFGKKRQFFLLAFILGVILNFHYSPLILIPFFITVFIIKSIKPTNKEILKMFLGFVIPLSPLLIYDISHKFIMMRNLFLWFPYRILLFLGLYKVHEASVYITPDKNISFFRFVYNSFIPENSFFPLELFIVFLIFTYFAWQVIKVFKKKFINDVWLILLPWAIWGYAGIFIHGSPPLHYFVPLFPLPILIFSMLFADISEKKIVKYFIMFVLFFFTILNFNYYFSNKWFFPKGPINYEVKQKIAKFIVKDSNHKKYVLHRIGFNDTLPNEFKSDYVYLLWLYGNEPAKKASLQYTIIEDKAKIPKQFSPMEKLFFVNSDIVVERKATE